MFTNEHILSDKISLLTKGSTFFLNGFTEKVFWLLINLFSGLYLAITYAADFLEM